MGAGWPRVIDCRHHIQSECGSQPVTIRLWMYAALVTGSGYPNVAPVWTARSHRSSCRITYEARRKYRFSCGHRIGEKNCHRIARDQTG